MFITWAVLFILYATIPNFTWSGLHNSADGYQCCGVTRIIGTDHRKKVVPIVRQITAGLPIYAAQAWNGSLVMDDTLYPGDNLFALKVQG